MRIRQTQLAAFIQETITNIRLGQLGLQGVGVTFQDGLPKEVEFTLEIVHAAQNLTTVTSQSNTEGAATNSNVEGAATNSNTEGTATNSNTEGAAINVETTMRIAGQITGEGGGDSQSTDTTYDEYFYEKE